MGTAAVSRTSWDARPAGRQLNVFIMNTFTYTAAGLMRTSVSFGRRLNAPSLPTRL